MVRRQARIAEHVPWHESAAIKELTRHFEVSLITMHHEPADLERQGIIRTALMVGRRLPWKTPLTVITNFVPDEMRKRSIPSEVVSL